MPARDAERFTIIDVQVYILRRSTYLFLRVVVYQVVRHVTSISTILYIRPSRNSGDGVQNG